MEKLSQLCRPSLLVLLVAGLFFAWTAAPGITALDAGELGAASWELGIAHPPGFPVFTQLQRAVMSLIPTGDIALRGNFASGLLAALTLAILVEVGTALGVAWGASVVGALCIGVSPWFLLHGTTIEVYSGLGAWLAVMLWLTTDLYRRRDMRTALLMAFVMGLGIGGHHPETRLFALAFCVPILIRIRTHMGALVGCFASGCAGLATLAYLPLRSARDPWRNWGNPSDLSGLWDHFWGARIRAAYGSEMGALDQGVLENFSEQLLFGAPLLCTLGVLGLALTRRKSSSGFLLVLGITDFLYAVFINPMGVRDLQNGLPIVCILGLATMLALQVLVARTPRWSPWLLGGLCVGILTIGTQWEEVAHGRTSRATTRLMMNCHDSLPPEALALPASDTLSAGFAYTQVVEGFRPDVAAVVRQHVAYPSSVGPVARRCPRTMEGWQPGAKLTDLTALKIHWPLGWEWASGLDAKARPKVLSAGFPLLLRISSTTHGPRADATETPRPLQGMVFTQTDEVVYAGLMSDQGQARLQGVIPGPALPYLEKAVQMRPRDHRHWTNLGTGLAAVARFEDARQVTKAAVDLAPLDQVARLNLARYALRLKRYGEAIDALEPLLVGESTNPHGLALRGVARGNLGDLKGARSDFEAALRFDATQPEARAGLRRLQAMENKKSRAD